MVRQAWMCLLGAQALPFCSLATRLLLDSCCCIANHACPWALIYLLMLMEPEHILLLSLLCTHCFLSQTHGAAPNMTALLSCSKEPVQKASHQKSSGHQRMSSFNRNAFKRDKVEWSNWILRWDWLMLLVETFWHAAVVVFEFAFWMIDPIAPTLCL